MSARRVLVWPDIHFPYHSVEAVKEAAKFARSYKPDVFVQLGDCYDAESVSAHDRDPSRPSRLVDELRAGNSALDAALKGLPGKCERHITVGNHETRLTRYVWKNAPALDGLLDLGDVFGLKARGFNVVPYGQMLKVGKFHMSHDLGRSGAGAARHALQVVQGNILIGHTHRLEVVYEGNPRGKPHVGCSAGWLGDPRRINYRHAALVRKDWMQAWVTLELDRDGNGALRQYPLF